MLGAEERLGTLESELFAELRDRSPPRSPALQRTARALARLDVLAGARGRRGARPVRPSRRSTTSVSSRSAAARHPGRRAADAARAVRAERRGLRARASACCSSPGPNMAGQEHRPPPGRRWSSCWRSSAASCRRSRAHIGVVDRVFTRVGASDNLARGQSHVHGRDARDRAHPPQRDRAEPGGARRDRARHEHLRRRLDRVGGDRAPARQRAAARRCSRRTTTS